jgi:type IV pilus assembly protein PilB
MRKSLAEIALAENLVDEARLTSARRHARRSGEPLVAVLVEVEHVDETRLCSALARHLRLPAADLGDVDPDALREVSREAAHRHRLLPLALLAPEDSIRTLRVAMADPTDQDAVAELEVSTGCQISPLLATLSAVTEAIDRAYRGNVTAVMLERKKRPFGDAIAVHTPAVHVITERGHRLEDEAAVELRIRALVDLLIAKGVITQEEYVAELKKLLRGRE